MGVYPWQGILSLGQTVAQYLLLRRKQLLNTSFYVRPFGSYSTCRVNTFNLAQQAEGDDEKHQALHP